MASSRPGVGTVWVRMVVYYLLDMKEASDVFWFSVSSGSIPTADLRHASAGDMYHTYMPTWSACVGTHVTFRGCYVEWNDGVGTQGVDWYEDVTGTLISDPMPEDVAVVVQKITAVPQPYARGRWYFAGAGQVDVKGSYLNGGGITDWQNFAIVLKGTVTPISAGGLILSPAHFSPHTQQLYPIVDTPVVALLGTRRRRRGPF